MATKPILTLCEEAGNCQYADLENIAAEVRGAAQQIIKAKRATYCGIGMALVRITKAIFGNENSVLTVSAMLRGNMGKTACMSAFPVSSTATGCERCSLFP